MDPHSGGQPPMGPPPGGMPPGGMPPGGMPPGGQPPMGPPPGGMPPGGPGGPYGGGPYGGDPYGGAPGPGYGGDPYGGQYAGGQYGPPTPPPSKGGGPWLWISLGCGGLFVIGVALVVLLVFFLSDDGDNGSDDTSGDTGGSSESEGSSETAGSTSTGLGTEERSNPDMPGVGEEVSHNGMVFSIVEIEVGAEVPGYTPYGEYVVVYVQVSPDGNDDIEFWRDEQHLYDSSGTAIPEDYVATEDFDDDFRMDVPVSPGDSETVPIVFDVEDPSDISHMGLSAEFLGGDEVEVDVTG